MENIKKLLGKLFNIIDRQCVVNSIKDIKLRENYPIVINSIENKRTIIEQIITKKDIEEVISNATVSSIYAFEEELSNGFLYFDGGIRIGVSGVYSIVKGRISIKNIAFLTIRIPRQMLGAADQLSILQRDFKNTLIISPPGGGKTTLLRDFIRKLADSYDVVAIDERYELSGGIPSKFDFGTGVDFLLGIDKRLVLYNAIRSMSPMIVAMDEISADKDKELLEDLTYSGVKILATMHAENIEDVKNRLNNLYERFNNIIVLSSSPKVGHIKSIVRTN